MPQGLDILERLRAKRAALAGPPAEPEALPGEGVNPDIDAIFARIEARKKAREQSTPEEDIPLWRKILAGGVRVGGPWAGGLAAGAVAGPETGFLASIPAFLAGKIAAGAASEAVAEKIEGRKSLNPAQIAVQGGLNVIPFGGMFKIGRAHV